MVRATHHRISSTADQKAFTRKANEPLLRRHLVGLYKIDKITRSCTYLSMTVAMKAISVLCINEGLRTNDGRIQQADTVWTCKPKPAN